VSEKRIEKQKVKGKTVLEGHLSEPFLFSRDGIFQPETAFQTPARFLFSRWGFAVERKSEVGYSVF